MFKRALKSSKLSRKFKRLSEESGKTFLQPAGSSRSQLNKNMSDGQGQSSSNDVISNEHFARKLLADSGADPDALCEERKCTREERECTREDLDAIKRFLTQGPIYVPLVLKMLSCEEAYSALVRRYPRLVLNTAWKLFFPLFYADAEHFVVAQSLAGNQGCMHPMIAKILPFARGKIDHARGYNLLLQQNPEFGITEERKRMFTAYFSGTYICVSLIEQGIGLPENLFTVFKLP